MTAALCGLFYGFSIMAMKQTQTKFYHYSDYGLDLCAASKNKYLEVLKKVLALGFNEQTVLSCFVSGNSVTLEYGVQHNYVEDRVIKISSGPLSLINGGEFVIDSVTATSLTITIDEAPISIAGGFGTIVAPLGYDLVYELNQVQIYKFKALDESDLFLRMCIPEGSISCKIVPCVSNQVDLNNGVLIGDNLYPEAANVSQVVETGLGWRLHSTASSTYNNYSYKNGFDNNVGLQSCIVGSKYHLLFCTNHSYNAGNKQSMGNINGMLPFVGSHTYFTIPIVILGSSSASTNALSVADMRLNHISVKMDSAAGSGLLSRPQATANYLSTEIDAFNATTCVPLLITERATSQFLGFALGLQILRQGSSNYPSADPSITPSVTEEVDFGSKIVIHSLGGGTSSPGNANYFAIPIEEVKYG